LKAFNNEHIRITIPAQREMPLQNCFFTSHYHSKASASSSPFKLFLVVVSHIFFAGGVSFPSSKHHQEEKPEKTSFKPEA
jgi:hypothetical protein